MKKRKEQVKEKELASLSRSTRITLPWWPDNYGINMAAAWACQATSRQVGDILLPVQADAASFIILIESLLIRLHRLGP